MKQQKDKKNTKIEHKKLEKATGGVTPQAETAKASMLFIDAKKAPPPPKHHG